MTAPSPAAMIAPSGESQRVLLFDLDTETFAMPADCVREILEVPPVTQVPGAPEFTSGLINVRGAVVPLADLRIPFAMPASAADQDTRIIVIEDEIDGSREIIGILADRVSDVCELDDREVDAAPGYGMRWRPEFIRGIGRKAGAFVIIPDMQQIFRECAG